jgi:hypothetical protein
MKSEVSAKKNMEKFVLDFSQVLPVFVSFPIRLHSQHKKPYPYSMIILGPTGRKPCWVFATLVQKDSTAELLQRGLSKGR